MENKQEEISKIEQDAKNLKDNLQELYEKVGSYKNAKEKLEETNKQLELFISETNSLAKESHEIIKTINEIGSGEIFKRMENIETNINKNNIYIIVGFSVVIVFQILFFLFK